MNEKETLEYNKLCAEFLGIEKFKDLLATLNNGKISISSDIYLQSKFDSDWNWIMEVIEKIESFIFQEPVPDTYYEVRLAGAVYVHISSNNGDEIITVDDQPSKKEAVVKAIYLFLKWYKNENIFISK